MRDNRINGALNVSRTIGDLDFKRNAELSYREQMVRRCNTGRKGAQHPAGMSGMSAVADADGLIAAACCSAD